MNGEQVRKRGLFGLSADVRRLRADMNDLQAKERERDINDQMILARLQAIADTLEHKDQLHAAESRALKDELEAILLRFESRLPPSDS